MMTNAIGCIFKSEQNITLFEIISVDAYIDTPYLCGFEVGDIILTLLYQVMLYSSHGGFSPTLSLKNLSQKAKPCPQTFHSRVLHKLRQCIRIFMPLFCLVLCSPAERKATLNNLENQQTESKQTCHWKFLRGQGRC